MNRYLNYDTHPVSGWVAWALVRTALLVAVGLMLLGLAGCATVAPGCSLFGETEPAAAARCQRAQWGERGYLEAVNLRAIDGAQSCTDHVRRVSGELDDSYTVTSVFTCPLGSDWPCHASALVDGPGVSFVLDNGTLLRAFGGYVADWREFEVSVSHYWLQDQIGQIQFAEGVR